MSITTFIGSVRAKYDAVVSVTTPADDGDSGTVPKHDVLIRATEELPHEFFAWSTRDRRAAVVDVRRDYSDSDVVWSYRLTLDA